MQQKANSPLLFIHGFRGDSSGLKEIISNLPEYQCLAPDLPPTNHQTLKQYSAQDYAQWVADYITSNHLDHPILIGHSMGSIIAAATAEKFPNLINEKIILLSPISVKPNRFFAAITPLLSILYKSLIDYAVTRYLFVPKNPKLFKQTLKATSVGSAKYHDLSQLAQAAKFSVHHSVADFNFDSTTYFIAGKKDRICSNKKTKLLAKKLNAKSVFLPNSGHLINYECPELVAKHIKKFLS